MANPRTSWNSVMAKFTPAGKSAQLHPDSAGCPRPDLAIKCATHSGSNVGRKIWDRVWPRPIPLGFHAFHKPDFPPSQIRLCVAWFMARFAPYRLDLVAQGAQD